MMSHTPSDTAAARPSGVVAVRQDTGQCLCSCGCEVDRDFLQSSHCGLCQLAIHDVAGEPV